MKHFIYADNAATTKLDKDAFNAMLPWLQEEYGNASQPYSFARKPKKALMEARTLIAECIGAQPDEIYFTSGGTESDNWAIKGIAEKGKKHHTIATQIEHHAILNACRRLEHFGFQVDYLPVDKQGVVSCEDLVKFIKGNTELISVMMVNNEIGAIEPIEEIAKIIKAKNPNTIFHVDAIQAYGKLPIIPKNMGIDLLSTSGHKIHGPKGIGFLYIKEGTKISPIIFGGGQQKGMRSGTENVPGIVGLAVACEKMIGKKYENAEKIREVKEYFQERIKEIEDIKDNSGKAPHVASISFKKLRSEVLLHALEDREIYVSSGSACSSNKKQAVSGTLNAIALSDEFKDGTLRFSFSIENTKEEVDQTIEALKELVPMLRRFVRK